MTRVLDIDLDFFVRNVVYNRVPDAPRPDPLEYPPWSTETALMFLEIHVGLSPERPSRGAAVENHGSVFFMWRDLIRSGALQHPFDLVHLDAHADLGLADTGFPCLMSEIMFRQQRDRWDPETGPGRLNDGNFLAFAAACGWLERLEWVHLPGTGPEYLHYHMKNWDLDADSLQLKAIHRSDISNLFPDPTCVTPAGMDPPIPFVRTAASDYSNTEVFDLVFHSRSPAFSPEPLDELYGEILARYIVPA